MLLRSRGRFTAATASRASWGSCMSCRRATESGCSDEAHARAAGTNSIPKTAALKVVITARCVTFMMVPLSIGKMLFPELYARNECENCKAGAIFFSHSESAWEQTIKSLIRRSFASHGPGDACALGAARKRVRPGAAAEWGGLIWTMWLICKVSQENDPTALYSGAMELIFEIGDAEEGGLYARALGYSVFTEAE